MKSENSVFVKISCNSILKLAKLFFIGFSLLFLSALSFITIYETFTYDKNMSENEFSIQLCKKYSLSRLGDCS